MSRIPVSISLKVNNKPVIHHALLDPAKILSKRPGMSDIDKCIFASLLWANRNHHDDALHHIDSAWVSFDIAQAGFDISHREGRRIFISTLTQTGKVSCSFGPAHFENLEEHISSLCVFAHQKWPSIHSTVIQSQTQSKALYQDLARIARRSVQDMAKGAHFKTMHVLMAGLSLLKDKKSDDTDTLLTALLGLSAEVNGEFSTTTYTCDARVYPLLFAARLMDKNHWRQKTFLPTQDGRAVMAQISPSTMLAGRAIIDLISKLDSSCIEFLICKADSIFGFNYMPVLTAHQGMSLASMQAKCQDIFNAMHDCKPLDIPDVTS